MINGQSNLDLNISIKPNFILPAGILNNILKPGWGAVLNISRENLFINNLCIGIEGGFWSFAGKGDYRKADFIPVVMSIIYKYHLTKSIKLNPIIAGGISFINIDSRNVNTINTYIRPLIKAGFMAAMDLTKKLYISAETGFAAIFDGGRIKNLGILSVLIGVRF